MLHRHREPWLTVEVCAVPAGAELGKPAANKRPTIAQRHAAEFKKEEGGRHTPFFSNYAPQFFFRTSDVTGHIELPADVKMVMPGDNATFGIKLIHPTPMQEGLRFAVREGGRTVAAGVVSKIKD